MIVENKQNLKQTHIALSFERKNLIYSELGEKENKLEIYIIKPFKMGIGEAFEIAISILKTDLAFLSFEDYDCKEVDSELNHLDIDFSRILEKGGN